MWTRCWRQPWNPCGRGMEPSKGRWEIGKAGGHFGPPPKKAGAPQLRAERLDRRGHVQGVFELGEAEGLLKKLNMVRVVTGFTNRGDVVTGGHDDFDIRPLAENEGGELETEAVGKFIVQDDMRDFALVLGPGGVSLG